MHSMQGDEKELVLASSNSYQRLILFQQLAKDQFGAASPPGFYIKVGIVCVAVSWADVAGL